MTRSTERYPNETDIAESGLLPLSVGILVADWMLGRGFGPFLAFEAPFVAWFLFANFHARNRAKQSGTSFPGLESRVRRMGIALAAFVCVAGAREAEYDLQLFNPEWWFAWSGSWKVWLIYALVLYLVAPLYARMLRRGLVMTEK